MQSKTDKQNQPSGMNSLRSWPKQQTATSVCKEQGLLQAGRRYWDTKYCKQFSCSFTAPAGSLPAMKPLCYLELEMMHFDETRRRLRFSRQVFDWYSGHKREIVWRNDKMDSKRWLGLDRGSVREYEERYSIGGSRWRVENDEALLALIG